MPNEVCGRCGLKHAPPIDCVAALRENLRQLLLRIGDIGTCSSCGARIYWLKHLNGARAPYTESGLIHFADCPNADQHRRKHAG